MASGAGGIPTDRKVFPDATEFLVDPTSVEQLQYLLSDEAWERFVAAAKLPRGKAGALREDLNKLKRLMVMEDHIVSSEQLHRGRFMDEFPHVKRGLEESIINLYALADKVDEAQRERSISSVVAGSTDAVSAIGLPLVPVTTGSSLVLLETGVGLGAATAMTSMPTDTVQYSHDWPAVADARRLVSTGTNNEKVITEFPRGSTTNLVSLAPKCVRSLQGIAKNARACMLAGVTRLLAANAELFLRTGTLSVQDGRQVQEAFGGTALAMTGGARVFGAAAAGAFLLMDVISLVQEAKHLQEGSKSPSAEELQQQARVLESRLELLTRIHEILQRAGLEHANQQLPLKAEDFLGSKDDTGRSVKADLEKAQQALEKEQGVLPQEVKALLQGREEAEQQRKTAEARLRALQVKFKVAERERMELAAKVSKLQVELNTARVFLMQSDSMFSECYEDTSTPASHLQDTQELLQEENQQKLSLSARLKQLEDEKNLLKGQLQEEEEAKQNLEKLTASLQAQVTDMKKKMEDGVGCLETAEEAKRKLQKDLEGLSQRYEKKVAAYDKLEKTKSRLQQELDRQRQSVSRLEKQHRLDQAQRKACLLELEDTHASREEMLRQVKEKGKKLKSMEAETTQLQKVKADLEKAQQALEKERGALAQEVKALLQGREEAEQQRKTAGARLRALQVKFKVAERERTALANKASKLQGELDNVRGHLTKLENKPSKLTKDVSTLESQLQDTQELLQEENRQKLSLSARLKQLEDEKNLLKGQLQEEEEAKQNLEKLTASLQAQVTDMKKMKHGVSHLIVSLRKLEMDLKDLVAHRDSASESEDEAVGLLQKLQALVKFSTRELGPPPGQAGGDRKERSKKAQVGMRTGLNRERPAAGKQVRWDEKQLKDVLLQEDAEHRNAEQFH